MAIRSFAFVIHLFLTGFCLAEGNPFVLSVESDKITIQGNLPEGSRILEIPPCSDYSVGEEFHAVWDSRTDTQRMSFQRFEGKRDGLFSKYQLVNTKSGECIGSPQWVTDLSSLPARDFEIPWPESKKGLTCIVDVSDAISVGCRYLSEGIVLSQIIDWKNPNPEETLEVDGDPIPINMGYIRSLDKKYKQLTDAGVNITLIPVNHVPTQPDPGNPLIHPDTDLAKAPFHLGAFNLTNAKGIRCFRAALEFFAERYTRPDRKYGLISGMVIGNELQAHYAWHNMGDAPAEKVIREYTLALRLADLALRKHHRNLRAYASLEHHWTLRGHLNDPLKEIPGKDLIEGINQLACAEGNFPWHVAFHPYPENLFEPRFWKDRSAILHFETPRITFKNLEVLPAYMKQPHLLYQGKPRHIILSEQGFHTPKEADGEKIQAAAYAAAYYKISHMKEIDAFMLHRHVSARDEGGLDLGLWTWDPEEPSGFMPKDKKFIWEIFRLADTPEWEKAFEFAKPIVGIKKWEEMLPSSEIGTEPLAKPSTTAVVYDFYDHLKDARLVNEVPSGWRPEIVIVAGGWPTPSIMHHPPPSGVGEATFEVQLPEKRDQGDLILHFYTAFTAESENGVRFAIHVDGESVWSHEQKDMTALEHQVSLAKWAGKQVRLSFLVDALGNTSYDWAQWVQPQIVFGNKR